MEQNGVRSVFAFQWSCVMSSLFLTKVPYRRRPNYVVRMPWITRSMVRLSLQMEMGMGPFERVCVCVSPSSWFLICLSRSSSLSGWPRNASDGLDDDRYSMHGSGVSTPILYHQFACRTAGRQPNSPKLGVGVGRPDPVVHQTGP